MGQQLASVNIHGLEKASAYPVGGLIAISVSSPGADFTVYLNAGIAAKLGESLAKACADHYAMHPDRSAQTGPDPGTKVAAKS